QSAGCRGGIMATNKTELSRSAKFLWFVWFWIVFLTTITSVPELKNTSGLVEWTVFALVLFVAFGIPVLLDRLDGFRQIVEGVASVGRGVLKAIGAVLMAIAVYLMFRNIQISIGTFIIIVLLL